MPEVDLVALQRRVGNRAVVSLLRSGFPPGPAGGRVQRYTEVGPEDLDPERRSLAPIWMSEGREFFRPANAERELWAQPDQIERAKAIVGHGEGILDLEAGGRTDPGREYLPSRRVVSNLDRRAERGRPQGEEGGPSPQVQARELAQ